ncbi:hypothetical protein C0583_03700 [Candidatus Parcubacteria bacterium]|nr:MAG: hypothetical protein C0583_03700 [Candidatus Parcubacteria bacterium]
MSKNLATLLWYLCFPMVITLIFFLNNFSKFIPELPTIINIVIAILILLLYVFGYEFFDEVKKQSR